mmetsp:Transcript_2984/g.4286  ORF Transcript_2984/g.4286 Transcript_2984/m.4286 type:complete len:171 (-) Transcript_2984:246-758(-)
MDSINLKVHLGNDTHNFRIERSASAEGLFLDFCGLVNIERKQIRFTFDGERIDNTAAHDRTVYDLNIKDGDVVDAHVEVAGGNGDEKKPVIEVIVKPQEGEPVTFKLKLTTKLQKIFTKYCETKGIDRKSVRFFIDGERVKEDAVEKTVAEAGLIDGDEIHAFLEQTGGR